MAHLLRKEGFADVNPLLGGIDAWVKAGYPTEQLAVGATASQAAAAGQSSL